MIFDTPLPLKAQCNGTITTEEAAIGIELTKKNSKELLDDAKLLFDNERYSRTIALAILAIEESGKIEKIKNLLLSAQKIHSLWRDLRSHKSKNFLWVFPLLKRLGVTDEHVVRSFTDISSNSVVFLDQLKQICFYVEAVKENGKCVWWLPSSITEKSLAEIYLGTAYEVVMDDGIVWTSKALDIFKSHASYEDGEVVYKNLLTFYRDLLDGGHITEDRFNKILNNYFSMSKSK